STPVRSGSVMAINRGGQIYGTIGGGCSEGAVIRDALQVVRSGGNRRVFVDMSNDVAESEGMVCGGYMWVFIDKVENI
ncbi:MAG: XdhC family protein, partial [Bacillota bacterium]